MTTRTRALAIATLLLTVPLTVSCSKEKRAMEDLKSSIAQAEKAEDLIDTNPQLMFLAADQSLMFAERAARRLSEDHTFYPKVQEQIEKAQLLSSLHSDPSSTADLWYGAVAQGKGELALDLFDFSSATEVILENRDPKFSKEFEGWFRETISLTLKEYQRAADSATAELKSVSIEGNRAIAEYTASIANKNQLTVSVFLNKKNGPIWKIEDMAMDYWGEGNTTNTLLNQYFKGMVDEQIIKRMRGKDLIEVMKDSEEIAKVFPHVNEARDLMNCYVRTLVSVELEDTDIDEGSILMAVNQIEGKVVVKTTHADPKKQKVGYIPRAAVSYVGTEDTELWDLSSE